MKTENPKSVPVPADNHPAPVLSQAPAVGFVVHAAEGAYKPACPEVAWLDSKRGDDNAE